MPPLPHRTAFTLPDVFRSVLMGAALFAVNNLAIWSGWFGAPSGYQPLFLLRNDDTAQYVTWIKLAQSHFLLPNYNAPWLTEPSLFSPLSHLVAAAAGWGVALPLAYHAIHLVFYILCSAALLYLCGVALTSAAETFAAFVAICCSLPFFLIALGAAPLAGARPEFFWPSLIDFSYMTADGLFRGGTSNSLTLTFGTATNLLALACIVRRIQTGLKRYTWLAALVAFFSAALHPFEVWLICAGSCAALFWIEARGGRWWPVAGEAAVVCGAGFLGMLPYIIQAARSQWLADVSGLWRPPSPVWFFLVYGLPTVLVAYFLLLRYKVQNPADQVLLIWWAANLVLPFVPFLRNGPHILDGYVYITALLLIRLMFQSRQIRSAYQKRPLTLLGPVAVWCVLCALGYEALSVQLWRDGRSPSPGLLLSSIASNDEIALTRWFHAHSAPDQLVLAPVQNAPWLATAPIPVLASHEAFSISYDRQAKLARAFYEGNLDRASAGKLLADFGVHWVVVPASNAPGELFPHAAPAARAGTFEIYELPANRMKPYPGLREVRPDLAGGLSAAQLIRGVWSRLFPPRYS